MMVESFQRGLRACIGLRRLSACAFVGLAALALATTVRGAQEVPEPASSWRAEAAEELLPSLEEHLGWCIDEKLFAQRDLACELLLAFDPNHARARRILKYELDDRGVWKRGRYKPKADRFPELAEEAVRRRATVLGPYRDALLKRYEEQWSELGAEQRAALREEVIAFLPDDPKARASFGQVRHPHHGEWVQAETVAAEERRTEIQARVRELLGQGVSATEASVTDAEKGLGLALEAASQTEVVRVLGAVEPAEVEYCALRCQAALVLLGELLHDSRAVPPMVVHLMPNAEHLKQLLERRPHLAERLDAGGQQRTGTWDPQSNELFLWGDLTEQRVEEAVEQALVWALARNHDIHDATGWAHVGLVTYVSAEILGDSTALRPVAEAILDPAEQRRRAKRAEQAGERSAGMWAQSLRTVSEAGAPDWSELFAQPASSLDDLGRFRAAALTRFVLEAHSSRAARVFERIGDGRTTERAFELPAGATFDDLGERVLGWVGEAVDVPMSMPTGVVAAISPGEERDLLRAFDKLSRSRQREVFAHCLEAARATGARQVALVDEWLRGREVSDVSDLPEATDFGAYDAEVYKGGPKRRYLEKGRSQYDRLLPEIDSRGGDPRPRPRRVRYEFSTGKIVRGAQIENELHDLEGLLLGELPEQEWAEALLLQRLDAPGAQRKVAEYFAHTYCDRGAMAYRGIQLFHVWDSEFEHEMPDPDVRAYAIEIWDDRTLPVPLSEGDKEYWYPMMGDSFVGLRSHVLTARSMAHLWFGGRRPLERGYDNSTDLIHASVAADAEDPQRLAQLLADEGEDFLSNCRRRITAMGDDGWNAGNERRDELIAGAASMRAAVLGALREAGL